MNTLGAARLGAALGVGTSSGLARGTVTFTGEPANADSITVGGRAYTYTASGPYIPDDLVHPAFIPGFSGAEAYARQFCQAINGGTYEGGPNLDVYAVLTGTDAVILYARAAGPAGNDITLARSGANITVSGANLTGGS